MTEFAKTLGLLVGAEAMERQCSISALGGRGWIVFNLPSTRRPPDSKVNPRLGPNSTNQATRVFHPALRRASGLQGCIAHPEVTRQIGEVEFRLLGWS